LSYKAGGTKDYNVKLRGSVLHSFFASVVIIIVYFTVLNL
jgi:hypothetical protein